MDCRGRGRHVAVAVGDRVAEGHITLFTRTRRIGEAAVVVVNQAAGTGQRPVDHCDLGREVDAVRAKRIIRGDGNRHRRIFGRLRDAVVYRHRHVVDDVNDKVAGGNVAVMVGHGDREGLRRIIARGVVEQRVAVPDRAARYAGDGQDASRIGDGLADRRDRRAVDRDHRGRIALSKGDRARRGLAIRGGIGAGGFTGAHRQAAFVDRGPATFAVGIDQDRRRLIGDADRQGRARRIAVAVLQRIGEDVVDAARRARIPDIGVASVGLHRQRAVRAVDDEIAGFVEARIARAASADGEDGRPVGALGVGPGRTAGGAGAGDHIAGFRAIRAGGKRVGIGPCSGNVVGNFDVERGVGGVAVAIGDDDGEQVMGRVAGRRPAQGVAVADHAIDDAGDREVTEIAGNDLAHAGYVNPVDRHRSRIVERGDNDGTGRGLGG